MAYIVIKTIKGRRYRYLQRTYRTGNRVRTQSLCLGSIDGSGRRRKGLLGRISDFIKAQGPFCNSLPDMETELFKQQARQKEKDARLQAALKELHDLYGLRLSADQAPQSPAAQEKAPSEEGAQDVSTPTPA
jgi:hypothetical protein